MDLEQYAEESAAAINAALEKYRFDKLALQDAEQTAALAREVNGRMTDPEEPPVEIDHAGTDGLRASLEEQRRALIRLQHDRFRITFLGGQVMMTMGVKGRGDAFVKGCLDAVRAFKTFNEENDPYGEHDFGVLEVGGQKVYWKMTPTIATCNTAPTTRLIPSSRFAFSRCACQRNIEALAAASWPRMRVWDAAAHFAGGLHHQEGKSLTTTFYINL